MANPFFTVGHSTHPIEVFVAQLKDLAIEVVADVRAVPRSRKNPQFNRDVLSRTLSSFELDYTHVPELGGLRNHGPVPPSVNGFWQNQSFHNYADYAMSDEFQAGLRRLREIGHARQCAVMCAEAVWWRCHRRIIADYLIAAGETVIHILAKGRTEPAYLTKAAVRAPGKYGRRGCRDLIGRVFRQLAYALPRYPPFVDEPGEDRRAGGAAESTECRP